MDKTAIFLMCENIKKQHVDVNKLALESPECAISYIHMQLDKAKKSLYVLSK